MIIRAVLDAGELDSFDWFNDGIDTILWLRRVAATANPAVARRAKKRADEVQQGLDRYRSALAERRRGE